MFVDRVKKLKIEGASDLIEREIKKFVDLKSKEAKYTVEKFIYEDLLKNEI